MAAGERPAKGFGPVAGLVGLAAIADRPGGVTCARREAGARKPAPSAEPAPSLSRGSPSRPESRPGRRRARLFGLPVLALLLAALGTLAAAPAQAQTTVWSATLTAVYDYTKQSKMLVSPALCVAINTGRTMHSVADHSRFCTPSAALTDDDFTFGGATYSIRAFAR